MIANKISSDILTQVGPPENVGQPFLPSESPIDEPPAGEALREEKSNEKALILLNEEVEDRKADRALRDKFGEKAYRVVRKTLYGWAILLSFYGFFKIFGITLFPDNVMIAITTAVTLNVFAAFLGVIRGLFPAAKPAKAEEKK